MCTAFVKILLSQSEIRRMLVNTTVRFDDDEEEDYDEEARGEFSMHIPLKEDESR